MPDYLLPHVQAFAVATLVLCLMGCKTGYDEERAFVFESLQQVLQNVRETYDNRADRIRFASLDPLSQQAMAHVDSVLALPPQIRYYSDSLAHRDSISLAYLHMIRIGHLYYHQDTTAAVFAYMKAMPLISVYQDSVRIDEMRRFAETVGDAATTTCSLNMARLAHQAFTNAEQLALASGNTTLFHMADSSRSILAGRVLTMPDSVRLAFGPTSPTPLPSPWALVALGAIFTLGCVAGYGKMKL